MDTGDPVTRRNTTILRCQEAKLMWKQNQSHTVPDSSTGCARSYFSSSEQIQARVVSRGDLGSVGHRFPRSTSATSQCMGLQVHVLIAAFGVPCLRNMSLTTHISHADHCLVLVCHTISDTDHNTWPMYAISLSDRNWRNGWQGAQNCICG